MNHEQRMDSMAVQIKHCASKVAYKRKGKAMIAANYAGFAHRPYQCPVCNQWHLTKQPATDQLAQPVVTAQ